MLHIGTFGAFGGSLLVAGPSTNAIVGLRMSDLSRDALIEATVKALMDAETNGLCGSTWPGPCDMCDCGLKGMTMAEAAAGPSAARERARVEHVLSKVLPLIADAIAMSRIEMYDEATPGTVTYDFAVNVKSKAARLVRSLLGTDSDR